MSKNIYPIFQLITLSLKLFILRQMLSDITQKLTVF